MTNQHFLSFSTNNKTDCRLGTAYDLFVSVNDVVTIAIGQPVVMQLLWIAFTSKKKVDILNFNLALIHLVHYLISFLHLVLVFLGLSHIIALWFLLTYTQIGGSLSLCFICLERYVAVIRPTHFPLLTKYRCREVLATITWLISIIPGLIRVLTRDNKMRMITSLKTAILQSTVMSIVVATIVYCTFLITRMLQQSGPGIAKQHPNKKRAFKTVRATTVIAISLYVPVGILQQSLLKDSVWDCFALPTCIFLLSIASVVHPIFYLRTQRKLLACFKRK